MTALLKVRDVVKHYGGIAAVDGASLDVEERSITGLIGPNGAGKTTLFNIVSGFVRPERGTVTFGGTQIERRSADRVARAGLVRTFQHTKALTKMTVLDNMMLAAPGQPGESLASLVLRPRRVRQREREVEAKARELLAVVRLESHVDEYAGTLSGGQRKLLELGRALMVEPRMVMLDEPMAGVNPTLGLELLDLVQELRVSQGTTFLLIEHDLEVVMAVCDLIHVMSDGAVIASGPPAEVRANPEVIDAYLGRHGDTCDGARGGSCPVTAPVLSVRGLRAGYGEQDIIHEVSLDVPAGSFVSVIGPNGAGKSTLLKAIYGLVKPRSGSIAFRSESGEHQIAGWKPYRLTRLGLNYVPQLANVFPNMTVLENLELGARVTGSESKGRVAHMIEMFPLLRRAAPRPRPERCRAGSGRCSRSPAHSSRIPA